MNQERDKTIGPEAPELACGIPGAESRTPNPEPQVPSPQVPGPDETPPLLGSWRAIYAVVLGELALCIALFWLFGRVFA